MTANQRLLFPINLSNAESEATTWNFGDTERITNKLEREI